MSFAIVEEFLRIRALSLCICRPLEMEDYGIQSMPDVSPPKWHLAHTTWFFEAVLLSRFRAISKNSFQPFDDRFHYLFNSYYNSLGRYWERAKRGLLSRPNLSTVLEYRKQVDDQVCDLVETCPDENFDRVHSILTLGMQHEQQHQELLVTDIKHIFCSNPTDPVFIQRPPFPKQNFIQTPPLQWIEFNGGLYSIGAQSDGFAYDHERPRHPVHLIDFALASRLTTNREFLDFIEDGGYVNPRWWLSLGWEMVQKEDWRAPLYWRQEPGARQRKWQVATLNGLEEVDENEPVAHVSFFEADAYARWRGARLPLESEWEVAAEQVSPMAASKAGFLNMEVLRPLPFSPTLAPENLAQIELGQIFGDLWEWTSSAYLPYPGFKPLEGPEGEYNGKFMSNQMVLRGGSCATPLGHVRTSYRNYFPPHVRWQFTGIRLARNARF